MPFLTEPGRARPLHAMSPSPAPRAGVDYLPDGFANAPAPRPPVWRGAGWRIALFALVFAALHAGWSALAGTPAEQVLIHHVAARPAAALIGALTPAVAAVAEGTRIRAAGGGLNILNGCDGMEVAFLLLAGFAAAPLGWRRRLAGLAVGLGLVFLANQARIVALFYAFRADRAMFDLLHTLILPIVLVGIVALFFHAWLPRPSARTV